MRTLHKSWKNDHKAGKWVPFTRRMRWFEDVGPTSIRLTIEDREEGRLAHLWFGEDKLPIEQAQQVWDDFKGGMSVSDVQKKYQRKT